MGVQEKRILISWPYNLNEQLIVKIIKIIWTFYLSIYLVKELQQSGAITNLQPKFSEGIFPYNSWN